MVKDAFFAGGFAMQGYVLEDKCRADEGEEASEFGKESEGFGLGSGVPPHPDWTWTSGGRSPIKLVCCNKRELDRNYCIFG